MPVLKDQRQAALGEAHTALGDCVASLNAAWAKSFGGVGMPNDVSNIIHDAYQKVLAAQGELELTFRPEGKFATGRVSMTTGAVAILVGEREFDVPGSRDAFIAAAGKPYLDRHITGDWGSVDSEDKDTNERAVEHGGRIMSVYQHDGRTIWVITEADRSATTMLTPEEY